MRALHFAIARVSGLLFHRNGVDVRRAHHRWHRHARRPATGQRGCPRKRAPDRALAVLRMYSTHEFERLETNAAPHLRPGAGIAAQQSPRLLAFPEPRTDSGSFSGLIAFGSFHRAYSRQSPTALFTQHDTVVWLACTNEIPGPDLAHAGAEPGLRRSAPGLVRSGEARRNSCGFGSRLCPSWWSGYANLAAREVQSRPARTGHPGFPAMLGRWDGRAGARLP